MKKFKVTGKKNEVIIEAESKGDAKRRFIMMHPEDDFLEIEKVSESVHILFLTKPILFNEDEYEVIVCGIFDTFDKAIQARMAFPNGITSIGEYYLNEIYSE